MLEQSSLQPSLEGLAKKSHRRKKGGSTPIQASNCAIAHVVLDVQAPHLGKTFDYIVSQSQDEDAKPGVMVRVKFGARRVNGIIWSRSDSSETPKSSLKFIEKIISSEKVASKSFMQDISSIAEAYGGTRANIIRLALPKRIAGVDKENFLDDIHMSKRQKWTIDFRKSLKSKDDWQQNQYSESENLIETTDARMFASYKNADLLKQALENVQKPYYLHSKDDFTLNTTNNYKAFLVDALPGAFRWAQDLAWIIANAISAGRQVAVVLPTIREVSDVMRSLMVYGLKPYKKSQNSNGALSGDVARLCAYDSPADRYRAWRAIEKGIVPCVLGTRSAMYAPVESQALFVIVEDSAYQYADGMMPYAQARGVMRLRAKNHNGVFVSMSFARSVISQSEVENKKLAPLVSGHLVEVTPFKSVVQNASPWVRLLNSNNLTKINDPSVGSRIPYTALTSIRQTLDAKMPVLLATCQDSAIQKAACKKCHCIARCKRCTGPLDLPLDGSAPKCAWCGSIAIGWKCSNCSSNSGAIEAVHIGVNFTAKEVFKFFKDVPIIVSSAKQKSGVVEWVEQKPMIVISALGSQPRVLSNSKDSCWEYGLVAILDAWTSLYSTGLDARIDTLNAWMKAASMCAPKSRDGSVLILGETYDVLAKSLEEWDSSILSKQELKEREDALLPPSVCVARIWGFRQAVVDTLNAIGAMGDYACEDISEDINEDIAKVASKNGNLDSSSNLPMLKVETKNNNSVVSGDSSEDSGDSSESEYLPPLLGIVPMKPPSTLREQNSQRFEELNDRVKAVVRVPLEYRDELVNRLKKECAKHFAMRKSGELKFSVDPKDL